MSVRFGLSGLLGVVAGAAAVAAKPPALPAPPVVEGRESTLLAREFYAGEPPAESPRGGVAPPTRPPARQGPGALADLADGVRGVWLNRVTIPLGVVSRSE